MRPFRPLPPVERLHELLAYDPETGALTWKCVRKGCGFGKAAGSRSYGYNIVRIDGRLYGAHRLIWKLMTGLDPALDLEHIDGDRANNRWANLREATKRRNLTNCRVQWRNASGIKGVTWDKRRRRWTAGYTIDGKRVNLGRFETVDSAHAAYLAAFPLSD